MNNRGISILEVLIGSAVLLVVGAGLSTLILNQANQVSYLEDRMSYQDLKKEIDQLLDDPVACKRSLEGTRVPVANDARTGTNLIIRNQNGGIFLNPGSNANNKYDKLEISGISFANENLASGETSGKGKLYVATSRQRTGVGPAQFAVIEKEIYMETNPAREILRCSGGQFDSGVCLKSDGQLTGNIVPSDAKAIAILIPGDSASYTGGETSSDRASLPSFLVTLPLDGSLHPRFVPGGTLQRVGKNTQYNGITIATSPTCLCSAGSSCSCTPGVIQYQRSGMQICTTPSNPAPQTGVTIYR